MGIWLTVAGALVWVFLFRITLKKIFQARDDWDQSVRRRIQRRLDMGIAPNMGMGAYDKPTDRWDFALFLLLVAFVWLAVRVWGHDELWFFR
jgi:hypothetical protein